MLADVPFVRWKKGKPTINAKGLGIITSNGCACEDYERAVDERMSSQAARLMLQVAPLNNAKQFPEDKLDIIKTGDHLDFFFLKGEGSRLADQVVDLSREQGIPASVLVDCKKVALIANWQWRRLLVHIAVTRFHQRPEELFLAGLLETGSDAA